MTTEKSVCEICGEPMPEGEEMFKFHGFSGPCPKPPVKARDEMPTTDGISAGAYCACLARGTRAALIELAGDDPQARLVYMAFFLNALTADGREPEKIAAVLRAVADGLEN